MIRLVVPYVWYHHKLNDNNDKYACSLADEIIKESADSDKWYDHFDDFAKLLNHKKSYVRNRAINILAANAIWDGENRFDFILDDYLSHCTDEKPITARITIKALVALGRAKPEYITRIIRSLDNADISKYKDSMRPLISKDIKETKAILKDILK